MGHSARRALTAEFPPRPRTLTSTLWISPAGLERRIALPTRWSKLVRHRWGRTCRPAEAGAIAPVPFGQQSTCVSIGKNIRGADKPVSIRRLATAESAQPRHWDEPLYVVWRDCFLAERVLVERQRHQLCASVIASSAPAIWAPLVSPVCGRTCDDPCPAPCSGVT